MPEPADVLRVVARRTAVTIGDFAYHSEQDRKRIAALMRQFRGYFRVVDEQGSRKLRSHQLLDAQQRPFGVVIGNDDYARPRLYLGRRRDSSLEGYWLLPVPKGWDIDTFNERRRNGEPYYMPRAKWITPSPFGPGKPTVVNLHHDPIRHRFTVEIKATSRRDAFGVMKPDTDYWEEFVDAEDLVELLRVNDDLEAALRLGGNGIWLRSCSVDPREARHLAKVLGVTHFSTGDTSTWPAEWLFSARSGNSTQPFAVTDDELRKFAKSLGIAAPDPLGVEGDNEWTRWSTLLVFGDVDSRVLPIQTVTPKNRNGEAQYLYLG
jgi:hypothetical protein